MLIRVLILSMRHKDEKMWKGEEKIEVMNDEHCHDDEQNS